ncbi:MAG: hypothetical protein ABEJ84_01950 [Halodesulfurarchaeum sp.]
MVISQESNREKNRPLVFRGIGKFSGVEITVQEGLTFLRDRIVPSTDVEKKASIGQQSAPVPDVISRVVHGYTFLRYLVPNDGWEAISFLKKKLQNTLVDFDHPIRVLSHTHILGQPGIIAIGETHLGSYYNLFGHGEIIVVCVQTTINYYKQTIFGYNLLVVSGTTYGSGRPKARNAIRGIPLRESCEPVIGPPARGGSAGTSSETMSNHDSTGLESREPDDASTDEDILIAGNGAEILTDGGEQDDDRDDEADRLDNPAWKDRLGTDGGIDEPQTLTTLKCRIRGRSMFGGVDDGAE